MGGRSDRRRSATGGEPVGNGRDEKGNGREPSKRLAEHGVRQHGIEDGHEQLAVREMLGDAIVVRRVVVRVDARVRLWRNREEANHHQRTSQHERDEDARGRGVRQSAQLQIGCK